MNDGKTSAPGYLTEPELIALMDVNGIGTDATMAEHIEKIKIRNYVFYRDVRGRGGGGGEGAAGNRKGSNKNFVFIPSNLGIGLVEAYDAVAHEMSLSRPFLRKEMEINMKKICNGELQKNDVITRSLEQYREVYAKVSRGIAQFKEVCGSYLTQNDGNGG